MKKLSGQTLYLIGFLVFFSTFIPTGNCENLDDIIREASSKSRDNDPDKFFAMQIGAYLNQENADQQVISLKSQGFDPYIFQSLNSKNQTVYAVRLGRFADYRSAADEMSSLKEELNIPLLIARYDSLETVDASDEPAEPPAVLVAEQTAESSTEFAFNPEEEIVPDESTPETPGSMQERIKALEDAIKQLREEEEVRKELQITEEESTEEEEDILEAAGTEYVLTEAGNIKFTYGFGYNYSEYDAIKESVRIEDVANHSISNSFGVSYGLKNNITVSTSIPFVYKYHKIGTVDSQDVKDLGDLSLNWQFQPLKSTEDLPTFILNGGFNVPVGRSPYEIQSGEELSTSSGMYTADVGASVSQVSDPVVVFSSLSLSYPFDVTDINQKRSNGILEEVRPGMGIGLGAGMGYALSYKLNLNLSFSYSYNFETEYIFQNSQKATSGDDASASMNIGFGYRLTPKQNLNFRIGIPLTDTRRFSFSFSTPIEFEL